MNDISSIMNSPILWVLSSIMVIASVVQAIVFLRGALKESKEIGLTQAQCSASIRSSCITSIGPSLAPVVSVLALLAVIGGPTSWMRLCDVGAARTELGVISLIANMTGTEVGSSALDLGTFSYALWGMALNNLGWLLIVFLLTHRMSHVITWMNSKYDAVWCKAMMGGATMALFGYLLTNQLATFDFMLKWLPACLSAGMMLLLTTVFKKHKTLQEVALGLSLLFGILVTQAIVG